MLLSRPLGVSAAMLQVERQIQMYAAVPRNILLLGPTGVGKGLVARRVHELSGCAGEFITLAGGQLSDSLLHSQLFGHFRGAFTDAKEHRKGALEQAAGGTLFLDEIPHWSKSVQTALLVALSEGIFRPLGSERDLRVACRIVFASHSGPEELAKDGVILPDLRWRLPRLQIAIPPLAERRPDVLWLADQFLKASSLEIGGTPVHALSPETVEVLLGHSWPGNVRELKNCIDVAVIHAWYAGRSTVELDDLPLEVRSSPRVRVAETDAETLTHAVQWALDRCAGHQGEAARLLGVHRNTIGRRKVA